MFASFNTMFDSKKGEVGYAKREIDRNGICGGNSMRQVYLQLWAIMTYRYRATKCDSVPRLCHIDSFCRNRANIDSHTRIYTYIIYPAASRLRLLSHLHEIGYATLIIQNLKPEIYIRLLCSLMETQATNSVVRYIGASKQQFSRGTSDRRIVFDITDYWFLWPVKFRKLVLNDINGD